MGKSQTMSMSNSLRELCDQLETLRIPYAVVGSLASSARGVPRSTLDGDLVAAIAISDVDRLVNALGSDWYADPEQMKVMIAAGRAFNIIHQPSFFKFDIFPANDAFENAQLERAKRTVLPFMEQAVTCQVVTPEDVLLAKLRWYRQGGEVSERQWSDIKGILRVNKSLDVGYMKIWALKLGVSDLLSRALVEPTE